MTTQKSETELRFEGADKTHTKRGFFFSLIVYLCLYGQLILKSFFTVITPLQFKK